MDALGIAIRVDARGREVMRILPRVNEAINEEWISDKTRHVWDGLRTQRLDRPYVRRRRQARAGEAGTRRSSVIAGEAQGARRRALRGDRRRSCRRRGDVRAEALLAGNSARAISIAARTAPRSIPRSAAPSYLFNSTIAGIDQADAILLIGTNPRHEAPVLNARILKRCAKPATLPIGLIGEEADLTYRLRLSRRRARDAWPRSPTARILL